MTVSSSAQTSWSPTDHSKVAGVYNLTSTGAGAYTLDAANLFRVVEANNTLTDIYADLVPAAVNVKVYMRLKWYPI